MVRSVADRGFLPMKNLLEEVGDMMILTGKTIVSALRPPYPYGGEFVQQFLFTLRLCWFPLLVSMVAAGYGLPLVTIFTAPQAARMNKRCRVVPAALLQAALWLGRRSSRSC